MKFHDYIKSNFLFAVAGLYIMLTVSGCKKLIEIDTPLDKYTPETVFSSTATAVAAVNAIYSPLASSTPVVGENGLSIRLAVSADELGTLAPDFDLEYRNDNIGAQGWTFWTETYRVYIYRINAALEGLAKSTLIPPNSKQTLTAELKFLRAFLYFNLVNIFGDVPIVKTTDFQVNYQIARSPINEVYKFIEEDLLDAQAHLPNEYLNGDLITSTPDRVRANKAAATALLARVYLYQENWEAAEREATKVIDDNTYKLELDLDAVFLKTSQEAIWQLQPNLNDFDSKNTPDGRVLINLFGGNPRYFPSTQLLNSFEAGDWRREKWIDTSSVGTLIIYKYKQGWGTTDQLEYTMVLRLAEMYLIRAEARARQNKLIGANSAQEDLNVIRERAHLSETSAQTQDGLLTAIDNERRVELFLEWGDRWFNLKRRGQIDDVMSEVTPLKGGTWLPYKALAPIPYDEFNYNQALRGHQNPGYKEQP